VSEQADTRVVRAVRVSTDCAVRFWFPLSSRDSIVRWAICDSPSCRKWRILPKHTSIPSDASVHWYCGNLTSRSGGRPSKERCARRDDWIVKCVGERLAKEIEAAGITTVAQLEPKEKGVPPPHYETVSRARC
jgi:hypothetical protein